MSAMPAGSNPKVPGQQPQQGKGSATQPPAVNPEAKDHWKKGNAFFEESKFTDAVREFTTAIEIDRRYADAYFNRALTERVMNNFSAAKKDLYVVMELQPKSPDAPLLIGDIAEANDDYIRAKFWYEKALAINPDYVEAKNRLEHMDSLMHAGADANKMSAPGVGTPKTSAAATSKGSPPSFAAAAKKPGLETMQEEKIEEGQIKRLAFYKSSVRFNSVIGLKKVKEYLTNNIILAIKEPGLFKKYGKKQGVGLLMYGPPGVGKTHIVNAIAGEANANVIIARINQIVDMYTGNTEKNLHAIFEQARKNAPCIIFFDELDALGVKRGGGQEGGESSALRLAVNQFLVEMNGMEANPAGIYVIGATNQPWDIDPALKRSGRFGDSTYIKPPNYKARKALFEFYTRNKPRANINFGRLARATSGYSPADIEGIIDKAAMKPLLHEYMTKSSSVLTTADIINVLKEKDFGGSSLDEWYSMVKKDVISKTETQIIDGKKQEIVKEGKLDAQEKVLYKAMVSDIKKNTAGWRITITHFIRWGAVNLF